MALAKPITNKKDKEKPVPPNRAEKRKFLKMFKGKGKPTDKKAVARAVKAIELKKKLLTPAKKKK